MPDIRQFTIEIETPDGTLGPAEVAVRDEPARLADLVPPIHALTSDVVALAVKRAGQEGRRLSCRPGCGACCCQLVPLAPAEAFYLVSRLLALPVLDRKPILQRFQSIENTLSETGLLARIGSLGETGDDTPVARDYFRLGLSCPFLADQSCSIHAWRPIACREYNVTSPPSQCTDPFQNSIARIRIHRRMSSGLTKLCTHVAGLPRKLVPMPLLFDYYETHREIAKMTWPGVELFKQALGFVLGSPENGKQKGK
jgi:Fe-S-cluster containining protein